MYIKRSCIYVCVHVSVFILCVCCANKESFIVHTQNCDGGKIFMNQLENFHK